MSTTIGCDMCAKAMSGEEVRYRVERSDQCGYYDSLDLCSAECLAALAVGEGHGRGERAAISIKPPPPPQKTRRWWQR